MTTDTGNPDERRDDPPLPHPDGRPGGRRATRAMKAAGEYWVIVCANCHHPGGLHIIDQWEPRITHCRCCAYCPAYADGDYGVWSDKWTAEYGHPTATPPSR